MMILNLNKQINSDTNKSPKKDRRSDIADKMKKSAAFGAVNVKQAEIPGLLKRSGLFFKKTYNSVLEKEIGQSSSNLINYAGKAIISPLMIFAIAPFTDEKKDSIRNSALLHPIQAVLAFTTAMGTTIVANKILDRQAKKGTLGNFIDPELGNFFNPAKTNGIKNLSKLKNISSLFLTVLAIPIAGIVLNKILPRILERSKDSSSSEKRLSLKKGKIYA